MNYNFIDVQDSYDGQVTELTLKPAPANVICRGMIAELSEFLQQQRQSSHKKLIVISGEGKHFSFGASVPEHLPGQVETMLPEFHNFIGSILALEIPILAKVTGCCLGGGFELALACTFIFADETAKFGVPEITLGVFPPPACILLPGRCGDTVAREMILTGEMAAGSRLAEKNIVNVLCAKGSLSDTVQKFIENSILPKSASALRCATRAAALVRVREYQTYIAELEKLYLQELMSTHDAAEGIRAFVEKRNPNWMNE